MALTKINISGIADDSIVDGPGIRATIFAQGCPHHCEGCHNPETHSFGTGQACSVQELFSRVKANPLVSGVTFSGGEPFTQSAAFAELAYMLKKEGYELAAYTGYTYEQLITSEQRDFLAQLDVIVDGKFDLTKRSLSLPFRGSTNQRIINVPASLQAGKAILNTEERWGYKDENEV